jgi:hypothetical protein
MADQYLCMKHGTRVERGHQRWCRAFRTQLEKEKADIEANGGKPPKVNTGGRRTRHQKLDDMRVALGLGFKDNNRMYDAVDYLFYEMGILLLEVEELKIEVAELKRRKP